MSIPTPTTKDFLESLKLDASDAGLNKDDGLRRGAVTLNSVGDQTLRQLSSKVEAGIKHDGLSLEKAFEKALVTVQDTSALT